MIPGVSIKRRYLLLAIATALMLASWAPAGATVYEYHIGNSTATVESPTVVLKAGTAGTSTVDPTLVSATAGVTAGLTFYETASAPASCSPPTIDTSLTAPTTSGSFTISPSYVTITVKNSQTTATSAGLQVLLDIDFDTYNTYLATNVGNIRFYSSTSFVSANELYAWMESFAGSTTANTATSSAVWVTIPSAIAASSSTTIYMVFLPTTSTFDGVYWGEASDLSATYGQYDNGAKVFLYYNPGGTSTGFNVVNGGSLGTTSMADPYGLTENVLALAGSGSTTTSSETVAWDTTGVVGNNFIIDGWVDILSTTDTTTYNANALYAARGATDTTTTNYILGEGWTGDESTLAYEAGTTNTLLDGTGTRSTGWHWSTSSLVGSALTNSMYTAPSYTTGTLLDTSTATNTNLPDTNTFIGIANYAGATGTSYFYQMKVRIYPPNDVLPTITFGSTTVNNAAACLISPQFTAASTLYAANWVADIWASAQASGSLGVAIYIVNSGGTIVSTLSASGATTGSIGTTEAQVSTNIAASAGTVAANDYVEMVFSYLAAGPLVVTMYWGTGQLTNFQTPSVYNYILAINNPTTSSWTIDLRTMSTLTSNLGRLSNATIRFTSPYSDQIEVSGGTLTLLTGAGVTLGAASTIDIGVVATANAMPTAANSPSTITFSLKVLSTTSASYAQYTITLTVG